MRIEVLLIILIVLVVLGILLVPWIIKIYNKLVWGRNKVKEIWANIEVQLNRRHELVPNLVSTVKGYAKHEDEVLNDVTEARSRATGAGTPAEKAASEGQLMMGLKSLYAVAEKYPDLKANQNFQDLQKELSGLEDAIQQARTQYNKAVSRYNTFVQSFPQNLIAGFLGFKSEEFYDAPDEANEMKIKM